mmetsp:Transcript_25434/g.21766  ORF Transcript_25434/g.21766 Transcript_25434/m.21766 type:complete len:106 (-) Transcript_25434:277-594(-)
MAFPYHLACFLLHAAGQPKSAEIRFRCHTVTEPVKMLPVMDSSASMHGTLTVHLAAVLLSLGEDPDDVRRMLGMSTPRKSPATLQTMSTVDSASYTATASPLCIS